MADFAFIEFYAWYLISIAHQLSGFEHAWLYHHISECRSRFIMLFRPYRDIFENAIQTASTRYAAASIQLSLPTPNTLAWGFLYFPALGISARFLFHVI